MRITKTAQEQPTWHGLDWLWILELCDSSSLYVCKEKEVGKSNKWRKYWRKCPEAKCFIFTCCILLNHLVIFLHCCHKQIYLDKRKPKVLLSGKSPLCLLFKIKIKHIQLLNFNEFGSVLAGLICYPKSLCHHINDCLHQGAHRVIPHLWQCQLCSDCSVINQRLMLEWGHCNLMHNETY